MMGIEGMNGTWKGEGTWHDSAGNKGSYRVEQTIRSTAWGLELKQIHTHDGAPLSSVFVLENVAEPVCRVRMDDKLDGYGGVFDRRFRVSVNNHLGSVTEIEQEEIGKGRLRVFGSCTRNSAGDYILWSEKLVRV